MATPASKSAFHEWCCCWSKLIYGQANCFYNTIFAPIILVMWAFNIYCLQCLCLYFRRCFFAICCYPCRANDCCWEFTDKEFPPEKESLGAVGGDKASGKLFEGKDFEWMRASELAGEEDEMHLFSKYTNSRDIMQGQLGDCWLLAAMAALADKPGAIYALFETKERDPRGKYKIRLFDGVQEEWNTIVIDDFIPCVHSQPLFSKPADNEMWVLLLEKAFAKFCGSYAAIEGGMALWALRAMTGDGARSFSRKGDTWQRLNLVNKDDDQDKRACGLYPSDEKITHDDAFEILKKYCKIDSVLCVGGASGQNGLIQGHAYSILNMKRAKGFRLVQIRNPHSHGGEWTGDWSDGSTLWTQHPDVKAEVGFESKGAKEDDDGIFWMAWEDFVKHWDRVDVVDRTIDIKTLRIRVDEADGCLAPTKACLSGCCKFWCLCHGIRRLYCAHQSSEETVVADRGWCSCLKGPQVRKTRAAHFDGDEIESSSEESLRDSEWESELEDEAEDSDIDSESESTRMLSRESEV